MSLLSHVSKSRHGAPGFVVGLRGRAELASHPFRIGREMDGHRRFVVWI